MSREQSVIFELGGFSLSSSKINKTSLVIASKSKGEQELLHFAGFMDTDFGRKKYESSFKSLLANSRPLPPTEVRYSFDPSVRYVFTDHLLAIHELRPRKSESVAEDIVWRYKSLLAWGESSSAKVLAEYFQISVRTVHTRLRMARDKGLLDSPGGGSRL